MLRRRPTVHFVFGIGSGAQLRAALRLARLRERIVPLDDDLSIGPIRQLGIAPRIAFLRRFNGRWMEDREDSDPADWSWLSANEAWFWSEAADASVRKVVWFDPARSREVCGLLEWVRRMGRRPYEVVDLSRTTVRFDKVEGPPEWGAAGSLARLSEKQIAENALWRTARPMAARDRASLQRLWNRLRSENGDLRLIENGTPVTAPLTVIDDELLAQTSTEWRPASRVTAYADLAFTGRGRLDTLLAMSRLHVLIDEGRLQQRQEGGRLEVRLV